MRVFLDTRDLIPLLERRDPCDAKTFAGLLERGGHQLVLTQTVVFELSAPIVQPATPTVVTRLLNDLESIPLTYLGAGQILPGELREAVRAFSRGDEYSWLGPFHDRFDASIPTSGPAPTSSYLRHGLAETVLTISQEAPDLFRREGLPLAQLRTVLESDRAITNPPTLSDNFREKIRRDLQGYGVAAPGTSIPDLADWIYASPARCPGLRLAYEVYHQIRRNIEDAPEISDFADFAHVLCLPYLHLATLDRRMATYVHQASRLWAPAQRPTVVRSTTEVIARL
jgi:hypothetical protein